MKQKQYSMSDIEKRLADHGVQPTLQRMALCQYVLCDADHPTAEDVFDWAQKNMAKISQETVYNTLGVLAEAGIVRTFKFPHSEKLVYDCNTEDHFHFFDEKSKKIFDVDSEAVKVDIELPKKFKVKSMDIVLKGEIK